VKRGLVLWGIVVGIALVLVVGAAAMEFGTVTTIIDREGRKTIFKWGNKRQDDGDLNGIFFMVAEQDNPTRAPLLRLRLGWPGTFGIHFDTYVAKEYGRIIHSRDYSYADCNDPRNLVSIFNETVPADAKPFVAKVMVQEHQQLERELHVKIEEVIKGQAPPSGTLELLVLKPQCIEPKDLEPGRTGYISSEFDMPNVAPGNYIASPVTHHTDPSVPMLQRRWWLILWPGLNVHW
jgi:hypothetical protein